MEAKELRIGNLVCKESAKLVNDKTEVYKIENINLQSAHKYEPIPLTEEWLLKFGFEKDNEYYSKGTKHYHLPSKSFYSGNDHVSGGNVDARIKYVHQLQNLYFALTGEELQFK